MDLLKVMMKFKAKMFTYIWSFGLDFTLWLSLCDPTFPRMPRAAGPLRPLQRVWDEEWEHVSWNNNLWIINGLVLEGSQRPPCEPEVSVNAAAAERRTDNNAPAIGWGGGGGVMCCRRCGDVGQLSKAPPSRVEFYSSAFMVWYSR